MTQTYASKVKLFTAAALALVSAGACVPSANAQNTYTNRDRVVLQPGTVIPVTLNNELTSNGSQSGDTFTANVDTSREAYNSILRGAVVDGIVREAIPQEGNDPGTLRLAFTRLRLPDGSSYVISGVPTSLDSKNLTVNSNGVLVAKGGSKKDQSLTYAGIGAGAGALIGILGGGKIRIEDILIGGGLGYAAGQVLKGQQQKVHDVDLKVGTPVGVLLNNQVLYHRRAFGSQTYVPAWQTNSNRNLKYYMYNGQRWVLDRSTGERRVVSTTTTTTTTNRSYYRANRKYYSYNGHPYYLNLNTGERVRLD